MTIQQALLFFTRNLSLIRSISTSSTTTKSSSFTVSYLIDQCGLSEEKAIAASKQVHFDSSARPDSVLTLLRINVFSKTLITNLVTKRPLLLLADPHKTLKPKFEFFRSLGASDAVLAKILSLTVMKQSLEKHIIPSYDFLKSIVITDSNVFAMLKRSSLVLLRDQQKVMVPNIGILRDEGVSESSVFWLLINQPRALLQGSARFREIVERVKEMGFDPSTRLFVIAIQGLTSLSKSTWESKLEVYRRWGWSEGEIRMAFRKNPFCMMAFEKKITHIMDFLVNQMGYESSIIARTPAIIMLSLEKRIIPRCLVMQVLISKGLVDKNCGIYTVLRVKEKYFLKKFVTKFEKEVPELMKVYQERSMI